MIGATCGVFDLLHIGHISCLQECRNGCDELIVLINSDDSVRSLKGGSRPIITQEHRKQMLLALDCVDDVIIFSSEEEKAEILSKLAPVIWFKSRPYTEDSLIEKQQVEAEGGRVILVEPIYSVSTTEIIEEIKRRHDGKE